MTAYVAKSKLKAAETLQCWLSHSRAAGNAIANGEAPATDKHARSHILVGMIGMLREEAELAGMTFNQSPLNDVLSIVIRWEAGEAISRGNLEATFRIMELETNRLIKQTVAHAQSASDRDTPTAPRVRVTKRGDIPAGPLGGARLQMTPRRRQILETLKRSKTRLSKPGVLEAMKRSGLDPGESTVRIELANLRNAGWIDNDQSAKPCGYSITALGESALAAEQSNSL
jgi:hypothetical protein